MNEPFKRETPHARLVPLLGPASAALTCLALGATAAAAPSGDLHIDMNTSILLVTAGYAVFIAVIAAVILNMRKESRRSLNLATALKEQ
jgi:tellurite resistance protein TehA-like permease